MAVPGTQTQTCFANVLQVVVKMFTKISVVTYCYWLNVYDDYFFSSSISGPATSTPSQNRRPKRSLFWPEMSPCAASPQLNLSISERYSVGSYFCDCSWINNHPFI